MENKSNIKKPHRQKTTSLLDDFMELKKKHLDEVNQKIKVLEDQIFELKKTQEALLRTY